MDPWRRHRPWKKALAAGLAACLLAPPAAAQQAVQSSASGSQAPLPSVAGASLSRLNPSWVSTAVRAGLSTLTGVLRGAGLPLKPAADPANGPRPSAGVRDAAARSAPAASLSLPPAAVPAADRLPASPAPAAAGRAGLRTAARALSGDPEAGRALPGLARLGAEAGLPGAWAGSASLKAAAESEFHRRANLPDVRGGGSVEVGASEPEQTGSADSAGARASKPSQGPAAGALGGSGSGGGKVSGEAPAPEPKYPSRPVAFNGKTFPSSAFRPDRPIEPLIVEAIDAAQKSVHLTLYEFKSREILKALRRAKERGLEVHIIVDYSNTFPSKRPGSEYTPHRSLELQSLLNEGFEVTVLRGMWKYGIMHSKVMVFDGKMAQFGSYNYTWTSEEHHFENARFTDDSRHVRAFLEYWQYLRRLSVSFDQARAYPWPKELQPPPAEAAPSVEFNGRRFPLWFFSPGGGGEDWVEVAIEAARESVDVSMFTLRSTRIAQALLAAKKRGVKVRVVLDRSQADGDTVRAYRDWLAFHKIKVKTLAGPDPEGPEWGEKNHNKFMVVDGALVQTGSMNWTKNASLMSFENGHFTADKTDAAAYQAFFEDLYKLAEAAPAPEAEPQLPTDEQLVRELLVEPDPVPPPPAWPKLPPAPDVRFNGEAFPAYAMRPQDPVKDLLVKAIDVSQKSVQLVLYEFNLPEVLEALRRAKKRGVEIHVLIDYLHVYPKGKDHTGKDRQRSPEIQALLDEDFDVRVVRGIGSSGTNHNKLALFDGQMAVFGSYNWAKTAEENHFENVVFTAEPERARFYARYWQYLRDLSVEPKAAESYDWNALKPGPPPKDEDWALELNGSRFPRTAVSPLGGIESLLLMAVQAAQKTIEVAMFSFYSRTLAEALLTAKNRGVEVRLVLDENQAKLMKLDEWFAYYGFDVRIVAGPDDYGNVMFEKMHHKFMRVDGKWLETGSYNYTGAAENSNFENANFFTDSPFLEAYGAAFEMLFERGWTPRKPKNPPELKTLPADFFASLPGT